MSNDTNQSPDKDQAASSGPIAVIPPQADATHEGHVEDIKRLVSIVATGVIGALVLVAAVQWYRGHAKTREQDALAMLANAGSIQDLEAVRAQFPKSKVAPLAQLQAAKAHYSSGAFAAAREQYDQFLKNYATHEFAPAAELGIVHCNEAEGRIQEAADGFKQFRSKHPDSFLAPEAALGEGRCLEQLGRDREARQIYEDFIVANPKSRWRTTFDDAIDLLNRRMPVR